MPSIKTFDLIPIDRENTKRVIEISDAIVVDMGVFQALLPTITTLYGRAIFNFNSLTSAFIEK